MKCSNFKCKGPEVKKINEIDITNSWLNRKGVLLFCLFF